jgi:capsular polysaccharide biosynthesis protein
MNDNNDANAARDLVCPRPKESNEWPDDASDPTIHLRVPKSSMGDAQKASDKAAAGGGTGPSLAGEALPLLEAVLKRWRRLLFWGTSFALVGLAIGFVLWKKEYTAVAQLVRHDSPSTVDVFGYRQISPQTFVALFRSPELIRKVAEQAKPAVSVETLNKELRVMPEHNSDIFSVAVSSSTAEGAMELINLYAREAVRYTQTNQAESSLEVSRFLQDQIKQLDQEIASVQGHNAPAPAATPGAPPPPGGTNAVARRPAAPVRSSYLTTRLETSRQDLFELLTRYTDAHPMVMAQRAKIDALEQQIKLQAAGPVAGSAYPDETVAAAVALPPPAALIPGVNAPVSIETEVLRSKLQSLENSRVMLLGRQRAAQSFTENPPGYFRVLAPASMADVTVHGGKLKMLVLAIFCGVIGLVGAVGQVLAREAVDDHLKTVADLKRVTRLPLLASLSDLNEMSAHEQRDWAFRTWTSLQHHMSRSPNHGFVCGVTSSGDGEGRSTWVNLLARESSQLGFRVLTIATRPPEKNPSGKSTANGSNGSTTTPPSAGASADAAAETQQQMDQSAALATNALAAPAEVALKLTGPNPQPLVHIPLPGWVWNLERRKQWQSALNHWRSIDNIVILVELPPSATPEAVLLAQNLPNVVWLADSGKASAKETRAQLATLRHARCHLAGAVLNHEPKSALQNRMPRWFEFAN